MSEVDGTTIKTDTMKKSNIIKIWNGFQNKQELDTAVDAVRHAFKTDKVQVTLINAERERWFCPLRGQ